MTREEYLKELDSNLITFPREERDMAVRFYEEYFEDAGPEKEQEVIEELGKPYNLARTIIGETSLYSKSEVYIQYKASKPMPKNSTGVFASLQKPDAFAEQKDTAEDIMPQRARTEFEKEAMPNRPQNTEEYNTYSNASGGSENADNYGGNAADRSGTQENYSGQNGSGMFDQYYTHAGENSYTPPPKKGMSTGWLVFWILMTIFVIIPIVIPVLLCIFVVMLGVALVSIACILCAVVSLVTGIIKFAVSVPSALAFIFVSLVCAGIGLIMLAASIVFFFKLLPWSVRKLGGFFSKRRAA